MAPVHVRHGAGGRRHAKMLWQATGRSAVGTAQAANDSTATDAAPTATAEVGGHELRRPPLPDCDAEGSQGCWPAVLRRARSTQAGFGGSHNERCDDNNAGHGHAILRRALRQQSGVAPQRLEQKGAVGDRQGGAFLGQQVVGGLPSCGGPPAYA